MRKKVAQVETAEDRQTVHAARVGALQNKLVSLGARRLAMTTGPDKGPMDWYELNGQPIIVHLYADQGGYEVYAPAAGASLSVSDTFDALDRIAASNPKPLSVDRQLTGAVGDFVRMAAAGNTEADDLQRLACALLGQTTPNPKGAARGVIAEMERGPGATRASVGDGPLTLITIEQGGHVRTLDLPNYQRYAVTH